MYCISEFGKNILIFRFNHLYISNSNVYVLGLIAFMDDECLRPGDPTDKTLLAKLDNTLSYHDHYISHYKADAKLQKIMGRDVSF